MSHFFDQLEDQIRGAAHAQTEGRQRGRRSPWQWVRNAAAVTPILVSVGVTVVVALVAVVLIAHGRSGGHRTASNPAPALTRQEGRYVMAAIRPVVKSKACPASRVDRTPATTTAAPPAALLSVLGVLRRPWNRSDDLPRGLGAFRSETVYFHHVRLARVDQGTSFYVVPVAPSSYGAGGLSRYTACDQAMLAAVKRELPHIPRGMRKPVLAWATAVFTRLRRQLQQEDDEPGVCLRFISRKAGGATNCDPLSQVRQYGLLSGLGPAAGIVPDGVASVTLVYPSYNGVAGRRVSANVIGNVFASTVPISPPARKRWPTVIWRSADGRVIKTVPSAVDGFAPDRVGGGCWSNGPSRGFC